MEFHSTLRGRRILSKLTQQQLADKAGVSKQAISQFEKGTTKPKAEVLEKLSELLDFDFTKSSNAKNLGNLDFPYDMREEENSKFIDLGDGQYLMIVPLVNEYAYMGYGSGYRDPEYMDSLPKHTIIVNKHHKGNYQAFEAVGDSMENWSNEELAKESIPNGSICVGREVGRHLWTSKLHTHKWDAFIVVHKVEGIVIKKIIDHDVTKGIIKLSSLNNRYHDFQWKLDDVKQIFNVIDVSKRRN